MPSAEKKEKSEASVRIVRASKKQLYSITVLTREFFPYIDLNAEAISARMKSKNVEYYAALQGGYTIGFVDVEFKKKQAKILGLAVLQEFRGKGVGARLLKRAVSRARARGAREVFLFVSVDNAGAQKLYEKLGFRKTGALKRELWGKKIFVYSKILRSKTASAKTARHLRAGS